MPSKAKFDVQRKKNPMTGLTVTNNSSSAYTRAEKLLNYQPDNSLFAAHQTTNSRDPYAGFTKLFIMPGAAPGKDQNNGSIGVRPTKDVDLSRSS